MKIILLLLFPLFCINKIYAQHHDLVHKYDYYEEYQMGRLKHHAKTLSATSYKSITVYDNFLDSTIEERYPSGNIKLIVFRNRGQQHAIKMKSYLDNSKHQIKTVFAPENNTQKMLPIEEYFYGKNGLDSSKTYNYDRKASTYTYERNRLFGLINGAKFDSPDEYGKIKYDQEGKIIEDKRFSKKGGMISVIYYLYDYKGNNVIINKSDGDYHWQYTVNNTFDDDNNLINTKSLNSQTRFKYNTFKQKKEEISYTQEGIIERKTFFDYNKYGELSKVIGATSESSLFINYNRFGQETENYASLFGNRKALTTYLGKLVTHKKTVYDNRLYSDTTYKYDTKGRITEQTTYSEGNQTGDVVKTVNTYNTGCPIPNQKLVYWGETLYSKTIIELTPACKIKNPKIRRPSGLYIEPNDDPTPRGIDSYKPIYDTKKRLIEDTHTNTLKGTIYHIKIKYVKDKIRQVILNDMTLNFDENSLLTFTTLNGKVKDRYSYIYDKRGNWIRMDVKENIFMIIYENKKMTLTGTKSRFTEREITYY